MRLGFFLWLVLLLLGCISSHDQEEEPSRPNILLIVTDDLGYTELGCFGGEIAE